ncbi:MAG TPA: nucleotidyltransferase family protein [Candidatus Krumholzibacteria bacterium]|nr:nucleotidyltransferase family protein [Candidatus Krumholzibacteria bacterium]HPD73185.1 nucleotidyltransferase family protein [Candidatus Krumholzibacteria bacterium]HRY41937.1 nucleotidyltransferase family protein [Candidatus Krumholzibacteria bacterium]
MFEGVVLAAGRSRRAGLFKPAFRVGGVPLVLRAVDCLLPWCSRVVVVAGHRRADVAELVAGRAGVEVVVNEDHDRGMFTSVQIGARAIAPGSEGFFVLPADCPLVGTAVAGELIDAFVRHGGRRAVVPEHGGRGGHPVLLPISARARVLAAPATATLREIVAAVGAVRHAVADAGVLMDLDTPADLRALDPEPALRPSEE